MEEEFLKIQTDWTDTHPCDRERIENAARENTEGIFTVELPARVLFSDINGLCRSITVDLYKSWFGSDFKASNLRETEKLLKSRHVRRRNRSGFAFCDGTVLLATTPSFCHVRAWERYQTG